MEISEDTNNSSFIDDIIQDIKATHNIDVPEELIQQLKDGTFFTGDTEYQAPDVMSKYFEQILAKQETINQTKNVKEWLLHVSEHFLKHSVIADVMQIQPIDTNPGIIQCIQTYRSQTEPSKVIGIEMEKHTVEAFEHSEQRVSSDFLADINNDAFNPPFSTAVKPELFYNAYEHKLLSQIMDAATQVNIKKDITDGDFWVRMMNESNDIALRSRRGVGNVIVMSKDTFEHYSLLDAYKQFVKFENGHYYVANIKISVHDGVGDKILIAYNNISDKQTKGIDGGGYFVPYQLFDLAVDDEPGAAIISTYGTHFHAPDTYYTVITFE